MLRWKAQVITYLHRRSIFLFFFFCNHSMSATFMYNFNEVCINNKVFLVSFWIILVIISVLKIIKIYYQMNSYKEVKLIGALNFYSFFVSKRSTHLTSIILTSLFGVNVLIFLTYFSFELTKLLPYITQPLVFLCQTPDTKDQPNIFRKQIKPLINIIQVPFFNLVYLNKHIILYKPNLLI